MISDLFFYGKLKDVEDLLIYEEEFVLFYLNIQLQNLDSFSRQDVEFYLEKLYGKENIKNNGIIKFCEKHFKSKEKDYFLNISEEEKEFYKNTREYGNEIMAITIMDRKTLQNLIETEVTESKIQFVNKLKKCIIYYYWKEDLTFETKIVLLYRYFNIIKNYYKLYRIIDCKLEKIPELFNMLEITELNITDEQLTFLIFNNVFTLKNLKNMSIDALISIFCEDVEQFIEKINKYSVNKQEVLKNLKNEFDEIIKPEWAAIIKKRFDFNSMQKRTLADIGNELNLTRERVRQIENKVIQKLIERINDIDTILYCFYKDIKKDNIDFITLEELLKYIGNEQLSRYLIIILSLKETSIIYDEEYGIIYNSKEITLEEILYEAQNQLKPIIPISDVINYDKVKKYILDHEYKIYQGKILVRKGINISSIYMNEIKECFDSGYNIGSEDDYNKLINILTEKYGDIEIPSMHSIQAMIDRDDFVQINRGAYKAREYAVNLPEKLVEEITDYIIKNSPIVPYSLIFEKFKRILERIGIDNRFYLKGVIDNKIPKEFNTTRDFINTNSNEELTLYNVMPKIFKEFDDEFTMEDIKQKMPGLNEYNYENYVRAEEENGLIRISPKTYIYIKKLNITQETKTQLKNYIDNLFEKMESKILTVQKIYANLSIMNRELLNKLHITARFGDFELFSIIKYLFKEDYYYSRPVISKEENFTTSSYLLIKEYVRKMDKFSYNDIKNYIYKMHIGGLYSYMNFMEDLSDEYVQINKDSMMKIEKFEISEDKLERIKDFVDLLLKGKDFRTDNFDGYFMLPKLNKPWNKYLLIGIIRSYFKDEYEIENTTKFYDTTEFIVRRIG